MTSKTSSRPDGPAAGIDADDPARASADPCPGDPEGGPDRDALIEDLNELTLPLMWSLRQEAVRAFEPLGIRPKKALLLELIAQGFNRPKILSDLLDTLPPAVSVMLAELETKALLRRLPDPDDGRRIRLELTAAGEALRASLRERWQEAGRRRLAELTAEDLQDLIRIYRALLAAGEGAGGR